MLQGGGCKGCKFIFHNFLVAAVMHKLTEDVLRPNTTPIYFSEKRGKTYLLPVALFTPHIHVQYLTCTFTVLSLKTLAWSFKGLFPSVVTHV